MKIPRKITQDVTAFGFTLGTARKQNRAGHAGQRICCDKSLWKSFGFAGTILASMGHGRAALPRRRAEQQFGPATFRI
jgi:hypothetical protein